MFFVLPRKACSLLHRVGFLTIAPYRSEDQDFCSILSPNPNLELRQLSLSRQTTSINSDPSHPIIAEVGSVRCGKAGLARTPGSTVYSFPTISTCQSRHRRMHSADQSQPVDSAGPAHDRCLGLESACSFESSQCLDLLGRFSISGSCVISWKGEH